MKFKYINSVGEQALFEAVDLTDALYKNILKEDKLILQKIVKGKIQDFEAESYRTAAKQILENYERGKEAPQEKTKNSNECVMIVTSKQIIKPAEVARYKPNTEKSKIRNILESSKIRLFKKDKMNIVLDSE